MSKIKMLKITYYCKIFWRVILQRSMRTGTTPPAPISDKSFVHQPKILPLIFILKNLQFRYFRKTLPSSNFCISFHFLNNPSHALQRLTCSLNECVVNWEFTITRRHHEFVKKNLNEIERTLSTVPRVPSKSRFNFKAKSSIPLHIGYSRAFCNSLSFDATCSCTSDM